MHKVAYVKHSYIKFLYKKMLNKTNRTTLTPFLAFGSRHIGINQTLQQCMTMDMVGENRQVFRKGRLTNFVPVEAVGFTAIITSIFAVYMPHTVPGAPAYARISLLVVAVNTMVKALYHWLSLPDGGLEEGTNLFLGPPSPIRSVAVGLRRKEGQEMFWYSCVLVYTAYYAPHLTFLMLKVQFIRVVLGEVTNMTLAPFHFRGKSVLDKTPEEYGFVVELCLVGIPLLYAFAVSDV